MFAGRLGAGNGTGGMGAARPPVQDFLVGKSFTLRYDSGLAMDYKVSETDELQWRKNGGTWVTAVYQAFEPAPGVILFGHLLEGRAQSRRPQHRGRLRRGLGDLLQRLSQRPLFRQ